MAKDPAFLFYPGDYLSGTMHLNFECKGAYIDLLMLQFQKDHLTLHMIQHVLGHKFVDVWPHIKDKFKEKNGFLWNERLRQEKTKRVKFCESRQKNKKGKKNKKEDMFNHMSSHMENENENENISENSISENGKTSVKFVNTKTQGSDLYAKRTGGKIYKSGRQSDE
jgi:uncharacterized protein YdaU (DUF1376 family)